MKKEQYLANKKSIADQIIYFQNKNKELDLKYIEANKPFNIGDRLYHTKLMDYFYVGDFELSYNLEVRFRVLKEKKDGTVSKVGTYIWDFENFKLANK